MSSCVTEYALNIPAMTALKGKKVILASSSPRRKEILSQIGLNPLIIPSKFAENLPKSDYADSLGDYARATAEEKALDVYIQQVKENPEDPPDMVIGADTVSILEQEIFEKPETKDNNFRMLQELNDRRHDIVTGVAIVTPQIQTPGYLVRSFTETTLVHFADNDRTLLKAYVDSGEGLDKAGGYALQERGCLLIKKIEGDFNNARGFPLHAFVAFLSDLLEDEELFEDELL